MKVFVGTLESGEADFPACCEAIRAQTGVDITHFVISNQKEQQANRELFTEWNKVKHRFDLFLKVDADTVLANDETIRSFVQIFEQNPRVTAAQAWLHDYMTNGLLYGLTCVRNTVIIDPKKVGWPNCTIGIDSGNDIFLRGNDLPLALNPAGFHCHRASEIQAFHYGIHRAKKRQFDNKWRIMKAWIAGGRDKLRGYALLGYKLAPQCTEVDYASPQFQELFSKVEGEYDSLIPSVEHHPIPQ